MFKACGQGKILAVGKVRRSSVRVVPTTRSVEHLPLVLPQPAEACKCCLQPTPSPLLAQRTLPLHARCGRLTPAPLPLALNLQFVPNRNGCGCSVVQKVATPQDWDEFQKCQESLKNFEVLQDSRCKPGQAKGPC